MVELLNRRGHNLTPALRRKGGLTAAAKLTHEQRSAGGKQRAAQPTFIEHQRQRGRKGAQVTLQRYGPRTLVTKLAEWRRTHPTDLDRFVMAVLNALAIPYQFQVLVDMEPDRVSVLDFLLVERGPGGTPLVIEPGHRRWHGSASETLDGRDHHSFDAVRAAALAKCGYPYILELSDHDIRDAPGPTRTRIAAFVGAAEGVALREREVAA